MAVLITIDIIQLRQPRNYPPLAYDVTGDIAHSFPRILLTKAQYAVQKSSVSHLQH